MTFNPMMAKAVEMIREQLPEHPSVIEFGNQTMNLGDDRDGQSAEVWYRDKGFKGYVCIDVNDKHGAIQHDLNQCGEFEYSTVGGINAGQHVGIENTYVTQASLVTNNGTGEHIFNQLGVFMHAHELCVRGGIMLHVLPFINWLNHGFFSFHPLLFVDLAAANEYEVSLLAVGTRWGEMIDMTHWTLAQQTEQIKPKTRSHSRIFDAALMMSGAEIGHTKARFPNVMVIAALKKKVDAPFRIPVQSKYAKDVTDDSIRKRYRQCQSQ